MPFIAAIRLEDMVDEDAPLQCARRITDRGGAFMLDETRQNTPIDTNPFRDRPGRPRGAMRESIERSPVEPYIGPTGAGYRVRVYTDDPAAPHVEWDTRPHEIRPRRPGGTLSWRDRRTGDRRFAKVVQHPGTKGAHMFALGAAKTEVELERIAAPALRRFEADFVRGAALPALGGARAAA